MRKLKCYYAHTMTSYGSTIEEQDLGTLQSLGFEILNPNHPDHQLGCEQYADLNGKDKIMEYFGNLVMSCDVIAFRSLPNSDILSGVAFEIQKALEYSIPVIELPCSLNNRMMEYPETKQYLIELGHYKL